MSIVPSSRRERTPPPIKCRERADTVVTDTPLGVIIAPDTNLFEDAAAALEQLIASRSPSKLIGSEFFTQREANSFVNLVADVVKL